MGTGVAPTEAGTGRLALMAGRLALMAGTISTSDTQLAITAITITRQLKPPPLHLTILVNL